MTSHSETQSDHRASDSRLLSTLLDGMDSALFAVDTGGRVTHWNRQAERLLGWSAEEAVGRAGLGGWAVRDADAADVRKRLLAVLAPATEDDPRQVEEFALLRRDGGRVLVRAQTTVIRDAAGRPAGVTCAFGEVHARLDLERNLALSHALLADSSWAMVIVDADMRTVAVNDRAARALAVTPVDMLGEPLAEFFGAGLEELEGALEQTQVSQGPSSPVELWITLHDDGSREDPLGDQRGGLPGGPRRCLLSGFLRLGSPLAADSEAAPAPLGVAWLFQDITECRRVARDKARRSFRDSQLARATRAAAECEDPLEAAVLHLHYALAGFAEYALLDVVGNSGLVRIAESPGAFCGTSATHGVTVRYRPGHPALQALERSVAVRATGGMARPGWAAEHRWPEEAGHALCVVLRSRGRSLGVLTLLRGLGRRPFDRADVAYGEDVALRVGAAIDLGNVVPGG
ncbi:PAS domain-containing protein [Streptomyces sp. NBC_01803]|uniref:PAS domain-containing protein n=1 Tax=Streptomyces sp. NBC_01803 TaxID=2975946 RepID=UPI002DD89508|nr:PAS domain-containing protein [Streptomyces sp. NBC_01803]WSA44750.1 PAS domain-containing protein [Streptomyces sp. NBC_01803]